MNTLVNTSLCYIQKDNCYLMLHRIKKENDYNHDKWIGIGGKFENGESPEDCVIREVYEETSLTIRAEDLNYCGLVTFVDGDYTEFMHLFKTEKFSGQVKKDCDEGNLEWVPVSKMKELPHWQGDEIFLDFIAWNKPFFSLKLIYKDGKLVKSLLGGKEYNHFI